MGFTEDSAERNDAIHHLNFETADDLPFLALKELGQGGQAKVDAVEYLPERRIYARKRWSIPGTPDGQRAAKNMLAYELKILKKFHQERHVITVVATYSRHTELGLLHLPLADCDLESLLNKSIDDRRAVISEADLEQSLGCLCAALYFMHQQGVRHKDIKPQNILVHENSLVFTDFGLSKDFSELSTSITSDWAVGTRSYYAPEMANGKPRGTSADVFSLGCVLLEILSALVSLTPDDRSHFLSLKPYHRNLKEMQAWIKERLSRSNLSDFWLQTCRPMVAEFPTQRPKMSDILLRLKTESEAQPSTFATVCCEWCMEKQILCSSKEQLEQPKTTDFSWTSNIEILAGENYPTEALPNSNSYLTNGKKTLSPVPSS